MFFRSASSFLSGLPEQLRIFIDCFEVWCISLLIGSWIAYKCRASIPVPHLCSTICRQVSTRFRRCHNRVHIRLRLSWSREHIGWTTRHQAGRPYTGFILSAAVLLRRIHHTMTGLRFLARKAAASGWLLNAVFLSSKEAIV